MGLQMMTNEFTTTPPRKMRLAAVGRLVRTARRLLPEGRSLPEEIWARRHRGILILLAAHVPVILAFGLLRGSGLAHAVGEALVPGGLVVAATIAQHRKTQACLATFGLLACSAILIHLSGGLIEMHFHFFMMIGVISLYQDWTPYLLDIAFVAIHHGTIGVLAPDGVYNHSAARAHPWTWAGIHAGFVLGTSVVTMVAWRLNERYRAQAYRAHEQAALAEFSRLALSNPSFSSLSDEAVRLLAATLETEYAAVLELVPDLDAFLIRAGVGWTKDLLGTATIGPGTDTHAGAALRAGEPIVLADLRQDSRFSHSQLLHERGVVSGVSTVISGPDGPYGVLAAHTTQLRSFEPEDLNFLSALANILGGALRRTQAEEQLVHQALHDPLTALPNRALFNDRLDHALARAGRSGAHTAVALLDLDDFKAINDSLGHAAGDELLVAVAERLANSLRPGDTIARLGGDEFVALLEESDQLEALKVADRMLEALRQPLVIEGRALTVHGSVGVATSRTGEEGRALLRNADLAMYAAKRAGKGGMEVFHSRMHEAVLTRMDLEADLRRALQRAVDAGEFRLLYQAKMSLATDRLTGVEALVRWQHPERGLIQPADFIPLAEQTGLIVPIGAWVLEEACRQSVRWQALEPERPPLVVAVNVSGRQFESDFVDTVRKVLATTGANAGNLCLEVTESVVMKDVETAVDTLRSLKALGVKLSLDDFGTGFSSLTYLKQFPLDELKIDKSFVDGLGRRFEDEAIVAAITGLAHALGLGVVAEGVETEAQVAILRVVGCETVQGHYFSRPSAASAIDAMLDTAIGAVRI